MVLVLEGRREGGSDVFPGAVDIKFLCSGKMPMMHNADFGGGIVGCSAIR